MKKQTFKKNIHYALAVIWFITLSVPLTYMMGSHTLSPHASSSKELLSLADFEKKKDINVIHFLGTNCDCSKEIYEYLLTNTISSDLNEKVIIIGEDLSWARELKNKNYTVEFFSEKDFSNKYDLNAFPQLTITNKNDEVIYNGGYKSGRSPASKIEYNEIIEYLKTKPNPSTRPIFGCLSSEKKQNEVNFFGFSLNIKGLKI